MNEIIMYAGFGIIGGIVRTLVESLKGLTFKQFSWKGFWMYSLVVLVVGAFSGVVLGFGKILSFLAGYAGLDLIDGYYKAFMKKKIKIKS